MRTLLLSKTAVSQLPRPKAQPDRNPAVRRRRGSVACREMLVMDEVRRVELCKLHASKLDQAITGVECCSIVVFESECVSAEVEDCEVVDRDQGRRLRHG